MVIPSVAVVVFPLRIHALRISEDPTRPRVPTEGSVLSVSGELLRFVFDKALELIFLSV